MNISKSMLDKILCVYFRKKVTCFFFTSPQNRILNDLVEGSQTSLSNNNGFKKQLNTNKTKILHELKEILQSSDYKCNPTDLILIYYKRIKPNGDLTRVRQNVKFLRSNGVSVPAIVNSSAVLTMDSGKLLRT